MGVNEHFFAWLDRLNSGDVKQGEGVLHRVRVVDGKTEESMCCLGVCSSMFAEDLGMSIGLSDSAYVYNSRAHYPDEDVLTYMGIPESHIQRKSMGYSVLVTLSDEEQSRIQDADWCMEKGKFGVDILNDNGFSFEEIAVLLRQEFAPETMQD